MKTELILSALAVSLLLGCSSKDAEADAEAAVAEEGAPAPLPAKSSAEVKAALNTIDADLEAKKYDEAVGTLTAMKLAPKSEKDEQAYREKLFEVQQKLLEQAENDARARESYQMLGRMVQGR